MTGRARSATASPRTTSATVGVPTGSAPSTSGITTAGRCRSRRHAPSLGCRWAATRTRSTTSRQTGRGDGWVRSATARMADGSAARPSASPDPMPGLVVTAWTVAAGRAECDDPDAHDEVAPPRHRLRQSPPGCRNVQLVRRSRACADGWRAQNYGYRTGTVSVRTTVVPDPVVARIRTVTSSPFRSSDVSVTAGSASPTATVCQVAPVSSLTWTM